MMLLTHMQTSPRTMPPMTISPLKNPGDDMRNRRPDLSEETQMFMEQTDECLKALGKECGNVDLRMGKLGISSFRLHKFTIVVEVPRRDTYLRVYTLLHRTKPTDSSQVRMKLLKGALELNYLQLKTFGACLSLDPCPHNEETLEFNLSYNHNMIGLDKKEFIFFMTNFMQTTREMYTALMKKAGLPVDMEKLPAHVVERIPPKPQRKVYVAYPRNHPRDLKMLYDDDVQDKREAHEKKERKMASKTEKVLNNIGKQPRRNALQVLQEENKAIVVRKA